MPSVSPSHLFQTTQSADLNYPGKTNKTWNFKRVLLELGKD